MGHVKAQKHRSATSKHHNAPKSSNRSIKRRQHSQTGKLNGKSNQHKNTPKSAIASNQQKKLKTPFEKADRVLLIGEGDFSFTRSLVRHHSVASIVATSYDDETALIQKYSNIQKTLDELHDTNQVTNRSKHVGSQEEEEWTGFSSEDGGTKKVQNETKSLDSPEVKLFHGIDATLLSKSHRKSLTRYAPFTKIVFNFPHTGGLSTDVNRQVRANQELLVGFFNAAKPLLATSTNPAKTLPAKIYGELENRDDSELSGAEGFVELKMGHILVTIFEGEPYTLWNIRDLARHCGLQVVESFRFPWDAYPGYKHARTVGDITTGKDRTDEGKRKGAWRGEEREARCYVLGLKDESISSVANTKRRRRHSESDDED